ncbi:MAG TPA: adenylate/guanylate cyclase domain-containing protein [Acidimicrobiales bacterium]|nr:adenylate/guanylate cyclase domain-containing protein [Acidimicrobiales bacterium]
MERAPELRSLVERLMRNWVVGDAAVTDLISREPGCLVIGTDSEEWWEGFNTVSALFKIQFQEMAEVEGRGLGTVDPVALMHDFSAWKEGPIAWVSARYREGGRITLVFREEGSFWRVVQWHASVGVSNEQQGRNLTTSVNDFLTTIHEEEMPKGATSSDGSVTIMFTDVEGSTSLMESLGEPQWLELLEWHDSVVNQQSRIFGGKVVKGQGDGFMLAFPATGSATACAVAIQRALSAGWAGVQVPVRIGLHRGNAKSEGGDFFGRTVVLAARIASAARGSEILVSQAVQEDLDGAFSLDEPRPLSLKGMAGTHSAFPLLWH